ncbi:hypothetical protein ROZALSC1DRAFT_23907, partial [Rozella allomycis CSF55]
MADLERLEALNVTSKVLTELKNHYQISDISVAEFVLAKHEESKDTASFVREMKSIDQSFSESFLENLDRIIVTVAKKGESNGSGKNGKGKDGKGRDGGGVSGRFPGLCIPDGRKGYVSSEEESEDEVLKELNRVRNKEVGKEKVVEVKDERRERGRDDRRDRRHDDRRARDRDRDRDRYDRRDRDRVDRYDDRGRYDRRDRREDTRDKFDSRYNDKREEKESATTYEYVDRSHEGMKRQRRKRLTSPERWDIKQMISSGIVKASEFPDLEEEFDLRDDEEAVVEEDVEIELRDDEPAFLRGQTRLTIDLSPIRV